MSVELSIIIPAFQAEEHLERCLSSILGQLSCSMEVIVVNDASTDGTMDIARSFTEKNPEDLKIIQNPRNLGVSVSRNAGLAAATGRLIMFVDADDWIDGQGCMRLIELQRQTKADLTCGNFRRVFTYRDDKLCFPKRDGTIAIDPRCNFSDMIPHLRLIDTCWGKLFTSEVIRQQNISFASSLKYGEDTLFSHAFVLAAKSVVIDYDCEFYRYFQRATSCVNTIDVHSRQQQIDILMRELANLSSDIFVTDSILLRKARKVISYMRKCAKNSQERKELLRLLWASPAFESGLYDCISRRDAIKHRLVWKLLNSSQNNRDAFWLHFW